MNKSLSPEHSKIMLEKMCEIIGIKHADVDFTKPNWYHTHTWTHMQEQEFITWLGKFLVKHKYVPGGKKHGKYSGEHEAGKIVANYGWLTKYD